MFRIVKVLNNNSVLAIQMDNQTEVIILGKGIGFGKQINERINELNDAKVYELKKDTDRGDAHLLAQRIEPVYIEIAGSILHMAEDKLGELDANVLLPLADHIAYAVTRVSEGRYIPNPMTQDIKVLFPEEFAVANAGRIMIENTFSIDFDEDETSYIALHLHSALDQQKIADIVDQTRIIKESLVQIEMRMKERGKILKKDSLSFNRLLTHMKYMIARMVKNEGIELDMNDYVKHQYPETFAFAETLCAFIAKETKLPFEKEEVGYLAIHIERVAAVEQE